MTHLRKKPIIWIYLSLFDALRNLLPFVQFKKRKNTHGEVLILEQLQVEACTKSNSHGTKSRKASYFMRKLGWSGGKINFRTKSLLNLPVPIPDEEKK